MLRGRNDHLAVEPQGPHDLFQEGGSAVARLEEAPLPLRRDRQRYAGEPRPTSHVDAGTRGRLLDERNEAQRILDVAFLEAHEVAGSDEVEAIGVTPDQSGVLREFSLVTRPVTCYGRLSPRG